MIRPATPEDAAALRAIYAPYVEEATVTFERTVPSVKAVRDRIRAKTDYPWFVCELDGGVVGYTYAGKLRKRAAYQWAAETSVYVDRVRRGEGIGRSLYTALLECLAIQGFQDAYAVVTVPNAESETFHESMGFEELVRFPDQGYKGGEWCDVAWWRRELGDHPADPEAPLPMADAKGRNDWNVAIERAESLLER